jgi:DNA repair ATPase RecN
MVAELRSKAFELTRLQREVERQRRLLDGICEKCPYEAELEKVEERLRVAIGKVHTQQLDVGHALARAEAADREVERLTRENARLKAIEQRAYGIEQALLTSQRKAMDAQTALTAEQAKAKALREALMGAGNGGYANSFGDGLKQGHMNAIAIMDTLAFAPPAPDTETP